MITIAQVKAMVANAQECNCDNKNAHVVPYAFELAQLALKLDEDNIKLRKHLDRAMGEWGERNQAAVDRSVEVAYLRPIEVAAREFLSKWGAQGVMSGECRDALCDLFEALKALDKSYALGVEPEEKANCQHPREARVPHPTNRWRFGCKDCGEEVSV